MQQVESYDKRRLRGYCGQRPSSRFIISSRKAQVFCIETASREFPDRRIALHPPLRQTGSSGSSTAIHTSVHLTSSMASLRGGRCTHRFSVLGSSVRISCNCFLGRCLTNKMHSIQHAGPTRANLNPKSRRRCANGEKVRLRQLEAAIGHAAHLDDMLLAFFAILVIIIAMGFIMSIELHNTNPCHLIGGYT